MGKKVSICHYARALPASMWEQTPLEQARNKNAIEAAILNLRSQKGATKPKNRPNSTKEFSEQFEGVIGSLPIKTGVLRQIAPESSPERSAKSSRAQLLPATSIWGTLKVRKILVSVKFLSTILGQEMGASILWTPGKGASFFGIEMSFLWYRGGPSLLFGIEISFLVSRFGILLFSI